MTQADKVDNMEFWTWPPRYPHSYRPADEQAHWFPVRETMDPDDREERILTRIQQVMAYAWQRSPFYQRKWKAAGLEPGDIRTLEDFDLVPVVIKDELRRDQEENEPFGSYLCVGHDEVAHINGTSGTTGRPTVFGISATDWDAVANAHARVMWAMGIRPFDTVLIGSPLSLYLGSWGAYIGAQRLGATVFPFGAGAGGQALRTLRWMGQVRATVFYGTPSYALHLAEVAAENGIDVGALGLRIIFFSGEPGASIPAIRDQITDAFGARVYDSGSMAEAAPWMALGSAADEPGMLCWQDLVYTQVCDPVTLRRLPYGAEGTPVYTTLERLSQPMIKLQSGDLTTWQAPSADRGRTYPFLPRGVYGRIDDMFIVRGENIYPSAIDDVVMKAPGYAGEHRVIIARETAMDTLVVQVEHESASPSGRGLDAWSEQLAGQLRAVLGVGAVVVPVPRNTFDRTDFKSRRVIDDRTLLHHLSNEVRHT
ncbi:MAG: phenylacetate--CoA ligase family protein [Mycobacterium sp.]